MNFIELYPEEKLELCYANPFQENLGRLGEYQGIVSIPTKYYVVAENAHLVARNYHVGVSCFRRVIIESLPRADSIGPIAEAKLVLRTLAPRSHIVNDPAVSLVHRQASNYGHWLMDYLPRVEAALHFRQETGFNVKIIVSDSLSSWQLRSLELIGIEQDDLIPVAMSSKSPLNIKLASGIFSRSHSFFSDHRLGGKDALSPAVFGAIKAKIVKNAKLNKQEYDRKRLLILRKTSSGVDRRYILNEADLKNLLNRYDFQSVYLENLSFDQQVSLFLEASHVIAVHGSGLTNLLFSQGCHVFELFSSGHGIRPEYWQLTAMTSGNYIHTVVHTEPPFHDMLIPLEKVKKFLELTL